MMIAFWIIVVMIVVGGCAWLAWYMPDIPSPSTRCNCPCNKSRTRGDWGPM